MKRIYTGTFFLFTVLFLIQPAVVSAQSIFGAGGIGELRYFANVRSTGMGGSGIALLDPLAQNQLNPAAWPVLRTVSYSVGFRYEGLRHKRSSQNITSENAAINNFSIAIRPKRRLTFAGGIRPISDTDFNVITQTDLFDRTLKSEGGLSLGYFGLGYSFGTKLLVGAQLNYVFGTDTEDWRIKFNNAGIFDSGSRTTRRKNGSGFSAGSILRVAPKFQIGFVYMSETILNTEIRFSDSLGNSAFQDPRDITLPQSYGVGIVSELSQKLLFSSDVYRWQYQDLDLLQASNQVFNNSTRYSAGFEIGRRVPERAGSFRNLNVRVGGYYWELYNTDIDGSSMTEKFITFGFGIPFNNFRNRVDIAIEGGLRSSESEALGKEYVGRISVGLVGSELWFVRR